MQSFAPISTSVIKLIGHLYGLTPNTIKGQKLIHTISNSSVLFLRAEGQHHAQDEHVSWDLERHSPGEEHLLSRLWMEG